MTKQNEVERIRSAAVRKAGVVFPCFAHTYHEITRLNLDAPEDVLKGEDSEQGFVTTNGRFVDRLEALEIARAAKQIVKEHAPVHGLFSEDLRSMQQTTPSPSRVSKDIKAVVAEIARRHRVTKFAYAGELLPQGAKDIGHPLRYH